MFSPTGLLASGTTCLTLWYILPLCPLLGVVFPLTIFLIITIKESIGSAVWADNVLIIGIFFYFMLVVCLCKVFFVSIFHWLLLFHIRTLIFYVTCLQRTLRQKVPHGTHGTDTLPTYIAHFGAVVTFCDFGAVYKCHDLLTYLLTWYRSISLGVARGMSRSPAW